MRQSYHVVDGLFNSLVERALAEAGENVDPEALPRLQEEILTQNGWTFDEFLDEHLRRFDENPLEVFTSYSDACGIGLAIHSCNKERSYDEESI